MAPITYIPNFVAQGEFGTSPNAAFKALWEELNWVQMADSPRLEYYSSDIQTPYTYGRGRGERTYLPQPWHPVMALLRLNLQQYTKTIFEVCFCNGYAHQRKQLGWHADDSAIMDDNRPIAVISLGSEREIWFRDNGTREVEKLKLEHGSLLLMHPGMQDTHEHRIPKASFECGPRVSLTFRGYVSPSISR